jgi:hypothetical protein
MGLEIKKLITNTQLNELAVQNGYEYRVLKSIIQVESTQRGFNWNTGKIIIQFEPAWFKRQYKDWAVETRYTTWQSNRVGDQVTEWEAFNSAFAVDAEAAMKSTSIGMMQLMGFHYEAIGFKKVGELWDFAKESEYNQVLLAIKWIKTVRPLDVAIRNKDWKDIAYYYNGANYRTYQYDTRLMVAYNFSKDYVSTL